MREHVGDGCGPRLGAQLIWFLVPLHRPLLRLVIFPPLLSSSPLLSSAPLLLSSVAVLGMLPRRVWRAFSSHTYRCVCCD